MKELKRRKANVFILSWAVKSIEYKINSLSSSEVPTFLHWA